MVLGPNTLERRTVAVMLQIESGPLTGQKVLVRSGETATFGRAPARAQFAFQDTFMSSLHFAVECSPQRSRVIDQKSANGTFLNGAKIAEATLSNGDELRAGQTVFAVRLIADDKLAGESRAVPNPPPVAPRPDSPLTQASSGDARVSSAAKEARPTPPSPVPVVLPSPAQKEVMAVPPRPAPRPPEPPRRPPVGGKSPLLKVGVWKFFAVPEGWEVKNEFGIERTERDKFPSSVTATEEMLAEGSELQPFVESQISMLRQYLRDARIEAVLSPAIVGADEKASFDVRYSTKDGQILFYRRVYARSGKTVGTITLTSLESDLAQIRPAFDAILAGVQFQNDKEA